ncbi:hypothetical protein G5C66_06320 [Nocardioides sp. KC13]|uniref:Uncharacterized protein n=1 Tax=Nocardioides turkmenicus TaxID=2711220 RepID=A0A6M1QX56_9ACTN|nr:hypothetical protein [Nocardioides sp. KC13]NGN92356.1 hypothetical protein [Nocardioides sp. KC13]
MRSMTTRWIATWSIAASVLAGLVLTSCSSSPDDSGQGVGEGQVEEVSPEQISGGREAQVGLPTGVLTLKVSPAIGSVVTDSGDLRPRAGTKMVGIAWKLQPHSSSEGRDVLLEDQTLESLPEPSFSLLDGEEEIALPSEVPSQWYQGLVVGAKDPSVLQVEYDGVTQRVELDTGVVEGNQGEQLKDLAAASTTFDRRCPAKAFEPKEAALTHECGVRAVHVLPYITSLGWAPDGQTWVVVDADIDGGATVRIGQKVGRELASPSGGVRRLVFVAPNMPSEVTFDFGSGISPIAVSLSSN